MQVFPHHLIFDEIHYNRLDLQNWFQEVKDYRCGFGEFVNSNFSVTETNNLITHNKKLPTKLFETLDTYSVLGKHIIDFAPIQELVKKFNFDIPLCAADVDILIYKPNFVFHPHIDFHMNCGMMFPIYPNSDMAPIDFYRLPPNETWERAKDFRNKIKFERDFIYSYYYSLEHPSLFNGRIIHGVRNSNQERVFLRFKCLSMTFEDIIQKTLSGQFINFDY